jgi:fibro-slime domain-containing protein
MGSTKRNFNFCVEMHATFGYKREQKITVRGDDDIWVFINDKLVIDLGGVHTPKTTVVDLDNLGLTEGHEYTWDMFQCDRQPCGSNLHLSTNILLKQNGPLTVTSSTTPQGALQFTLFKQTGQRDECSFIGDSASRVAPIGLQFELHVLSQGVQSKMRNLLEGSNYEGGIFISGATVTVDTSKMHAAGVGPGSYKILAYESAKPNQTTTFSFRMSDFSTALHERRLPRNLHDKVKKHPDALGRRLKAKNRF